MSAPAIDSRLRPPRIIELLGRVSDTMLAADVVVAAMMQETAVIERMETGSFSP